MFLPGAWSEIRRRPPGRMLLVSLAIIVAFVVSAASTLGPFDLEFWWELSALVVIMLLGHWQEMKALGQARGAVSTLAALLPDVTERLRDGTVERISIGELQVGGDAARGVNPTRSQKTTVTTLRSRRGSAIVTRSSQAGARHARRRVSRRSGGRR